MMNSIATNLERDKSFHQFYDSEKFSSSGEANIISGLPTISLFLHLLGIKIFNPNKVMINNFNPFPDSVTVRFRGLTINSYSDHIRLEFPNGKSQTILDPTPCIVGTNST
jgi:hypothetical protein